MPLIKAKQIDIASVAASLTTTFNDANNVALRNSFVDSIKTAPGFDEKVKASSIDTTSGYLVDKMMGAEINGVTIGVSYNEDEEKVQVSALLDTDQIATDIAAKLTPIYFEANDGQTTYSDPILVDKHVIFVFREHMFLYSGVNPDDYSFDATTGTVTFNTALAQGERINMLIPLVGVYNQVTIFDLDENLYNLVMSGGGGTADPTVYDEQIVNNTGIINNLITTKNVLRFTGTSSVVLTGITVMSDRQKDLVIINNTGLDMNIQHLSTASNTANRINVLGATNAGDNTELINGHAIRLNYINGQWYTTNWYSGYHPNLRGGTSTKVLEILPNGQEQTTESYDFEIFRPDIITDQTDTQLNTLYPGVYRGTTIYAKNISGGGKIYKKDDEVNNTWVRIALI